MPDNNKINLEILINIWAKNWAIKHGSTRGISWVEYMEADIDSRLCKTCCCFFQPSHLKVPDDKSYLYVTADISNAEIRTTHTKDEPIHRDDHEDVTENESNYFLEQEYTTTKTTITAQEVQESITYNINFGMKFSISPNTLAVISSNIDQSWGYGTIQKNGQNDTNTTTALAKVRCEANHKLLKMQQTTIIKETASMQHKVYLAGKVLVCCIDSIKFSDGDKLHRKWFVDIKTVFEDLLQYAQDSTLDSNDKKILQYWQEHPDALQIDDNGIYFHAQKAIITTRTITETHFKTEEISKPVAKAETPKPVVLAAAASPKKTSLFTWVSSSKSKKDTTHTTLGEELGLGW
jgi:hypothetical protein